LLRVDRRRPVILHAKPVAGDVIIISDKTDGSVATQVNASGIHLESIASESWDDRRFVKAATNKIRYLVMIERNVG
jgi:hypothetical protein